MGAMLEKIEITVFIIQIIILLIWTFARMRLLLLIWHLFFLFLDIGGKKYSEDSPPKIDPLSEQNIRNYSRVDSVFVVLSMIGGSALILIQFIKYYAIQISISKL